ncbi:hypothetical protein ACLB2K_028473 [Fragaria x ananassa]
MRNARDSTCYKEDEVHNLLTTDENVYLEVVRCNEIPKQLMDLPTYVLVDILLSLPVKSLCSLRCVCKTLLNTIGSRSFIRRHTLSLIAGNNHVVHRVPQLMCLAQETCVVHGKGVTTFATLQSLRYDGGTALTKGKFAFTHSASSPIADYVISFVFYNLFCMDLRNGRCLLINVFLKKVINWFYNLCAPYALADVETRSRRCPYNFFRLQTRRVSLHSYSPDIAKQQDSILHSFTLRGSMAIVETFPLAEGGIKVEIWVMKDYAKKEWAREHSIHVDRRPEFESIFKTCGEWEHGIFFNDRHFCFKPEVTRLFLDLRSASVNNAICPLKTNYIRSYNGSLISLRDFATSGDSADEPSS